MSTLWEYPKKEFQCVSISVSFCSATFFRPFLSNENGNEEYKGITLVSWNGILFGVEVFGTAERVGGIQGALNHWKFRFFFSWNYCIDQNSHINECRK